MHEALTAFGSVHPIDPSTTCTPSPLSVIRIQSSSQSVATVAQLQTMKAHFDWAESSELELRASLQAMSHAPANAHINGRHSLRAAERNPCHKGSSHSQPAASRFTSASSSIHALFGLANHPITIAAPFRRAYFQDQAGRQADEPQPQPHTDSARVDVKASSCVATE